jgi:predicted DCC family thiol-disulfide oxidoreductase YuxK
MISIPENKQLILFDGVCSLCNRSVQFVIKHDKNNKFVFTALQSDVGIRIIKDFNIDTRKTDSILLYTPDKGLSIRSTAALNIAKHLRFPINTLIIFKVIPNFIRNWIYDLIARNRYKWFGRMDDCMVPTQEIKAKFLE